MSEKQKYSFECLEQKCTTKACHVRPSVNVTIGDLSRWTAQNHLQHAINGLGLIMPESETEPFVLETLRKPLESDPEQTACIFYHEESNGCHIRFARPISCRTYPLEYNGEKFFLTDKECPGIGQGEISKEALKEARDLAEQEYQERMETYSALPALYSLIFTQLLKQSAEAMKSMSEEDRKKLDEIMAKKDSESEPTSENDEKSEEKETD